MLSQPILLLRAPSTPELLTSFSFHFHVENGQNRGEKARETGQTDSLAIVGPTISIVDLRLSLPIPHAGFGQLLWERRMGEGEKMVAAVALRTEVEVQLLALHDALPGPARR